jgi:hypothetical protein
MTIKNQKQNQLLFYLIIKIVAINLFILIYLLNILSVPNIILLISGYLIFSAIFLFYICSSIKRAAETRNTKVINFLMYLIVPSKILLGILLPFIT